MSRSWYALRSKPRKERSLYSYVTAEDIECYYPCLEVNPVNPRSRKTKPYFPGYLFVQVDLEEVGRNRFRWTPNSLGLVRFGGEPAQVPENLIRGIRRTLAEINEAGGEELHGLQPGDPVRIEDGPFAGYRGAFEGCLSGRDRVCVLLDMLAQGRTVAVEMDPGCLRKM